jgi:NAD(P)-dependent dehydrogenase (short-subunit alcohol dehydrogenase family)
MAETILITGPKTNICQEFKSILSNNQIINYIEIGSGKDDNYKHNIDLSNMDQIDKNKDLIKSCDKIVLAHGILGTERFLNYNEKTILHLIKVNLLSFIRIIEIAIKYNSNVRIAVIGSESGIKGSFDISYSLSKAALHKYIEERKILFPTQQLICIAPSMIVDSGMTLNREDQDNVKKSTLSNPKERGLFSNEIAQMIYHLLFIDKGYTTNTVININGGKFARM